MKFAVQIGRSDLQIQHRHIRRTMAEELRELAVAVRKSETGALRHPVLPVADGLIARCRIWRNPALPCDCVTPCASMDSVPILHP
jgi:hypothetical protein